MLILCHLTLWNHVVDGQSWIPRVLFFRVYAVCYAACACVPSVSMPSPFVLPHVMQPEDGRWDQTKCFIVENPLVTFCNLSLFRDMCEV